MDRAPRNQKGNGLRMYGPGYRGGLSKWCGRCRNAASCRASLQCQFLAEQIQSLKQNDYRDIHRKSIIKKLSISSSFSSIKNETIPFFNFFSHNTQLIFGSLEAAVSKIDRVIALDPNRKVENICISSDLTCFTTKSAKNLNVRNTDKPKI